jgi:hypothetical protein
MHVLSVLPLLGREPVGDALGGVPAVVADQLDCRDPRKMPRSYAPQFRVMVIQQVRSGRRVAEVAAALGLPESTVSPGCARIASIGASWRAGRRDSRRSCGRPSGGSLTRRAILSW